jgi:hypothetical protein
MCDQRSTQVGQQHPLIEIKTTALQLYSVRDTLTAKFEGTIDKVASWG